MRNFMKHKHLTSQELLISARRVSARERQMTTEVLWHIKEIEDRKLYLSLGFASLFELVVSDLGYSQGAAARRIQSARLLRDVPEISSQIESGELNISTLSTAQKFIREEEKRSGERLTPECKKEVIES